MVLDHFALFFTMFYPLYGGRLFSLYVSMADYIASPARGALRYIVISIFFIVSGICCSYSRNNLRRGVLLALFAGFISLITYVLTVTVYYCFVICGVIHCYAIFTLIYALVERLTRNCNNNMRLYICVFLLIVLTVAAIVIGTLKPTLDGSNALIFLGVPATGYVPPLEYASPALVGWAYFAGVILGFGLKKVDFHSGRAMPLLAFTGRHAGIIYLIHLPIIYAIIRLLTLI